MARPLRVALPGRTARPSRALPRACFELPRADEPDAELLGCDTSDGAGSYTLEGAGPGPYRVTASAPGHLPQSRIAPAGARVDFVLERGGVVIAGQVVDIGGGPVAGAVVAARSGPSNERLTSAAHSDDNGHFAISVVPGRAQLTSHADGYVPARESTAAPADAITIAMTPAAVIRGTVIRADAGEPIAGARVWVENERGASDGETRSDGDGGFEIGQLSPGRYRLMATSPGGFGQKDGILLGLAEITSPIALELFAVARVTGSVVIGDDKAPCTRGNIALRRGDGGEDDGPQSLVQATLDNRGMARFDAVLPGAYDVETSNARARSRGRATRR